MGVQRYDVGGHLSASSITDSPFAEPLVESIECEGKPLRPVAGLLFAGWAIIKQDALFGKVGEAGQAERHEAEPNPAPEGALKQMLQRTGEVELPAGVRSDPCGGRDLTVITVAKDQ